MKLLNSTFNMENLYIKQDAQTGMIAIIAIHNTKNGPALGGCRFVSYPSVDDAVMDAMKLARAMTYKSAMAGLPLGGGKSVIISHSGITDRATVLEAFGSFVNELNGKYITASDSGTNEADMKIVATRTRFITSINKSHEPIDDTAFMTASGVMKAIEAAVAFKFKATQLDGIHVAIQGAGSVGYLLTKMLLDKKAKVTLTDKNTELLARRANEFPVNIVDPDQIFNVNCDIFSPCALGGVLNQSVIENLKCPIICGAANNQLQQDSVGQALLDRNILFIPDYVANAGGVICAAAQAGVITKEDSCQKVNHIYDSVTKIVNLSHETKMPPHFVANQLADII
jgi:leucine dehydrogenase